MEKFTFNTFEVSDFDNAIDRAIERAIKEFKKPPKKDDLELLSRKDTAKILCISLPTLHQFTKEGIIAAYRIGNRVLYKQVDIDNALTMIVPPHKRGRSC